MITWLECGASPRYGMVVVYYFKAFTALGRVFPFPLLDMKFSRPFLKVVFDPRLLFADLVIASRIARRSKTEDLIVSREKIRHKNLPSTAPQYGTTPLY